MGSPRWHPLPDIYFPWCLYYKVNRAGQVWSCHTNRVLKPSINKDGYPIVHLSCEGQAKTCSVHRLVMMTFDPQGESCLEVNHKDRNKKNSRLKNLEWVTHMENIRHSRRT